MTSAKGIRGIEDEIDYLCNYNGLMFPETIRKITHVWYSTEGKNRDLHSFVYSYIGDNGEIDDTVKEKYNFAQIRYANGTNKRSILE